MNRAGSVLGDLRRGARFTPRTAVGSGVGETAAPQLGPQAVAGQHYAETRNVIAFSFDDSIDPTHPLDCFFQMPAGVLRIYSARLWVKPAPFRAYETAATSGGSAAVTSGPPTNPVNAGTGGATPATTLASGVQTASTEVVGHGFHFHGVADHGHTVNDHFHIYQGSHDHNVSVPSHSHGITYGIFESAAATGTLGVLVANDGSTFGAEVASGANISADIKAYLTTTSGDRQVRITTAGAGVQARVKVLLMLDVLLKVELG